jgi:hypothetical protein
MRLKFALTLVLATIVVAGIVSGLKHLTSQPLPAAADSSSPLQTAVVSPLATPVRPAPQPMAVTNVSLSPEQRQAAIDAEVSRLQDLSSNHDAASLSAILSDLQSPDKAVRLAAIEAAKQFGSQDAIPVLKADAATATDLDEQSALLEAADFLALPDIAMTGSGTPTPESPEQIQASQQKRTAMEIEQQSHQHYPSGRGQYLTTGSR